MGPFLIRVARIFLVVVMFQPRNLWFLNVRSNNMVNIWQLIVPGDIFQGCDTRTKLFFVGEFRKNTGQTMSEGGNGDEKRSSVRRRAMTKKVARFLKEK